MRSYYLLAALFLFIVGWLIFFHPFEVRMQNGATAQLQIEKFLFRLLTPQGEELWLKGQKGIKKADLLKIWDLEVQRGDERLLAKKGSYSGQLLRLRHDVRFFKKDLSFHCDMALYSVAKKILKVPGDFDLRTPTMHVHGRRLVYNQKVGTIKANDIKAFIKSL